ncbi:MAG: hypothetical protein WD802_02265 [Gemmatimonadaceae bacterium]
MGAQSESEPKAAGRGFVLGELLVAALLLAIAISSLTALMYSVTRHPRDRTPAECAEGGVSASANCVVENGPKSRAASGEKLLLTGCATRSGAKIQACNDSVLSARGSDGTTLRSRTDSASLEMLPKKPVTRKNRPDLGFVR